MLMSEIFPSCPPQWEDLRALSHAAVKDSCHPVSGSNTRTHTQRVNEKRGFEPQGRRRSQVKEEKPSDQPPENSDQETLDDQKRRELKRLFDE